MNGTAEKDSASIAMNLDTFPETARRRMELLERLAMESMRYAAKRPMMKLPKKPEARSRSTKTPKILMKKTWMWEGLEGSEKRSRERIFEEEDCRNVSILCICTRC